jgi:hypothetical protein
MTQYMLAVHGVDGAPLPAEEDMQAAFQAVDEFNQKLQKIGAWVFAGGLEAKDTATVVRVVDGEAMLTDGPFAESKEHLGGFWVIEAADLDVALELAKEASVACREAVEVRPFQSE